MKKTLFRIVTALCALLIALPVTTAYAAVSFTNDGAADGKSLYVAGNPDCAPIESYDADSDAYVGAAPAFLSLVSEKTGLDFTYIRAGEQDRRESLARNNQVDLLFAYADENSILNLGVEKIKLFSVIKNGSPMDVYCVFTSVSGEKDRAAIRSVAESLAKDDVSGFFTADVSQSISRRTFRIVLILLGSALICAVAALTVFLVLFLRRKRKKEAFVDNTTEIGNKNYFLQMFGTVISDQTREVYYIVHFAFAIDRINGDYGTEVSDRILRYAADTIKQRLKDNEFCARIGGGSFAVAICSNGVDQVERRVEEILRVLNAYGEKYMNGDLKALFHAGICALAIDDKNAEKVLYNADQAYRRAVEEKKPYVFVNHDVLNEYKTKVSIREQAGEALEKHEFTPYVQFIVDAKDGSICGGELLSRWETRLYGLLGPGSYIPILQDMGLIVRHDMLMMEEACKLLEQWQSFGKDYFLTCNLTRITVSDASLVNKVMSIAGRYTFAREKLILEVTEDSLEENKDSALHNILSLKEKGFHVALDDFSSGYTAVSNLYEYAVDLVKLDRQMILDADRDPQAAALMKEITRLCHELQIRVLAEGVENIKQAGMVRSVCCDYIQGHYFARALPLRELPDFEENYRSDVFPGSEEAAAIPEIEPDDTPENDLPQESAEKTIAIPVTGTNEMIGNEVYEEPMEKTNEPPAENLPETLAAIPVTAAEAPMTEVPTSPLPGAAKTSESAEKNMIHIQFGAYRMDLPGNIDMGPVSDLLRSIQNNI